MIPEMHAAESGKTSESSGARPQSRLRTTLLWVACPTLMLLANLLYFAPFSIYYGNPDEYWLSFGQIIVGFSPLLVVGLAVMLIVGVVVVAGFAILMRHLEPTAIRMKLRIEDEDEAPTR